MKKLFKIYCFVQLISVAQLCFANADKNKDDQDFSFEIIPTHIQCPGLSTGAAELNISGNSGPYVINWSNGATTERIENLSAGTYIVEVSDANGKNLLKGVTINEPQEIEVAFNVRNLLCFGASNGNIDISVSGGTMPYTFAWSSGETTEDLENISAGEYFLVITDANNCVKEASVTVSEPSKLEIAASVQNANCFDESNGEIDLAVFGGTTPYFYQWSNGETSQDLFNLPANDYHLVIIDGNNCELKDTIVVEQPAALSANLEVTNVSCNGADGKVDLEVVGGTPDYAYKWLNSTGFINKTSKDISSLEPEQYTVEITDENGCQHNATAAVELSPIVEITPEVQNISCIDLQDGAINLGVTGGVAPYSYLWSTGATSENIEALSPGSYDVTVADAAGCASNKVIVIEEPREIFFEFTIKPATCEETNDGAIALFVGGGASPYTYDWSDGEILPERFNLLAGRYTVNVTDSNGCQKEMTATVDNKDKLCLSVPKAFTPNGDTMNDTWELEQANIYPNMKVRIFNRWGKILFESVGYSRPWDGTFEGKVVPAGTYYYTIDLGIAGQEDAGSVTVIK